MITEVTEASFQKEVLEQHQPVLVEFYAPWCPKCAMVADVVSEFAEEYSGNIKVCRINIDREEGLVKRFGVEEVPAFLGFCRGKAVSAATGKQGKERLRQMMDCGI